MKLKKCLTLALSEPCQILHVRPIELMLNDGRDWCLKSCSRCLCNTEKAHLTDRKPLAGFTPILAAMA